MRQVPYEMWVGYYLLLLSHQGVRPKRLLDVCCGTGTMAEMLTSEGFRVDGFDLSPGMIEEARRKAAAKELDIRYEVMDAAEADMGETYEAALCFFDSLNNILDPARFQAALQRVAAHLPPGGSFIFDLNTAYAFEAQLFDQQNLKKNAPLNYQWKGDWDARERVITVTMRFWQGDREFTEVHRQRAYEEDEVRAMLAVAGFTDVRSYHSYTLSPPRKRSDRIHYAAIRG